MSSNDPTTGQTLVVITGAGRGFGRILVDAALGRDLRVIGIYKTDVDVDLNVQDSRLTLLKADCSREDELENIWSDVQREISEGLDLVVINNAGYYLKQPLGETDLSAIARTVESNILAAANITRRLLDITTVRLAINVVSSSGLTHSVPRSDLRNKAIYAASKRSLAYILESSFEKLASPVRYINLYPRNINTWSQVRESDSIIPQEFADWIFDQVLGLPQWSIKECVVLPVS